MIRRTFALRCDAAAAAAAAAKPAAAPPKKQQWSWRLPPGIEIYTSCVFVVLGVWYWLEAHYRRVDRLCVSQLNAAGEQTAKLNEIVTGAQNRWQSDVRGKEEMLNRVLRENARLAATLDRVTIFLRKCNVPAI
jgi:hypothetical protein